MCVRKQVRTPGPPRGMRRYTLSICTHTGPCPSGASCARVGLQAFDAKSLYVKDDMDACMHVCRQTDKHVYANTHCIDRYRRNCMHACTQTYQSTISSSLFEINLMSQYPHVKMCTTYMTIPKTRTIRNMNGGSRNHCVCVCACACVCVCSCVCISSQCWLRQRACSLWSAHARWCVPCCALGSIKRPPAPRRQVTPRAS